MNRITIDTSFQPDGVFKDYGNAIDLDDESIPASWFASGGQSILNSNKIALAIIEKILNSRIVKFGGSLMYIVQIWTDGDDTKFHKNQPYQANYGGSNADGNYGASLTVLWTPTHSPTIAGTIDLTFVEI